jgi:CheY-like chemotaxis protein
MKPNGVACGIRILVVEDDESMRKIVAFILSEHGYGCELANNGVEALGGAALVRGKIRNE